MSWYGQFLIQLLSLFFTYGTLVRYLHIVNRRMILEETGDYEALNGIRLASFAFSASLCLVMHLSGAKPLQFHVYYLAETDPAVYLEGHVSAMVLAACSLVLNVFLRLAIWRERQIIAMPLDAEEQEKSMTRILAIFGGCVVLWSLFLLLQGEVLEDYDYSLLLMLTIVCDILPLGVILWKRPIRVFAKRMYLDTVHWRISALVRTLRRSTKVIPDI